MIGAFAVTKQCEGDGAVRLLVRGEIDHDVSDALLSIVLNAMDHEATRELIIDLRHVTFLAAAGVRDLLATRVEAVRRGVAWHVADAHGSVALVLGCAGLVAEVSEPEGSPTPPSRPR
jgi:anti-anti-sigma factor